VSFVVSVERSFPVVQGLPSPVRSSRGLPPLTGPVQVTLRATVTFTDDQLTDRGWFFDTDELGELLDTLAAELSARPWTEIFSFRPTFELVARHAYERLTTQIPQLESVTLTDHNFGTTAQYKRT
jgi:6-pyruvoyl-tetrahydropterin synthase